MTEPDIKCVICGSHAEQVKASFHYDGQLYTGVPVYCCTSRECVQRRGGMVNIERHHAQANYSAY